ncbi:MAG: hypothetical protein ACOYT7_04070 [Patescibacteria group bacterium]
MDEEGKEEQVEKKEEKTEVKEEKGGKKQSNLVVILVFVAAILVGLYFVGRTVSRKIGEGIAGRVLSGIAGKKVKVSNNGDKVTITGEGGQVAFETGGDLPEDFPADFPVYTGAKLTGSFSAQDEQKGGVSVVWETSDSLAKVSDFYKKELPAKGWTVESTFTQNDSFTATFKKGETGGFVGVTPGDGGKVTINVTIGVK